MVKIFLTVILANVVFLKYTWAGFDHDEKNRYDIFSPGGAKIVLYFEDYFRGEHWDVLYKNIAESECYSGGEFFGFYKTASIKLNGICLRIYDSIGCTGNFKVLNYSDTCQLALANCGLKGKIGSLSPCNATISPPILNAVSVSGRPCKTNCSSVDRAMFVCNTGDVSLEPCFPNPQQHFFGHYCKGNCTKPEYWDTTNVTLYDKIKLEGHGEELMLSSDLDCVNIPSRYAGRFGSANAKQFCIKFFFEKGCTGRWEDSVHRTLLTPLLYKYQSIGLCTTNRTAHDCNIYDCGPEDLEKWFPDVLDIANVGRKRVVIANNTCVNLRENYPYAKHLQINPKTHCVAAFRSVGCLGDYNNISDHPVVIFTRSRLSVKLCNAVLEPLRTQTIGYTGKPCLNACSPVSSGIFLKCQIGANDGWDFCSLREQMDAFGIACNTNCTRNDLPYMVTLYASPNFTGEALRVYHSENVACHHLPGNDSAIIQSGIGSVDLNGYCIYLYTNIGCTGDYKMYIEKFNNAYQNLAKYVDNIKFKSLRFCTDGISNVNVKSCGVNGDVCFDECLVRGEADFYCATKNSKHELCYPRDGLDLRSETICPECGCFNKNNSIRAVVFEKKIFSGRRVNIHENDLRHCYNFVYDRDTNHNFHQKSLSLKLVAVECIKIYESIGCSGESTTINADLPSLADCPSSIIDCYITSRSIPKSISLCNSTMPAQLTKTYTLSGNDCSDKCESAGHFFVCKTDFADWEFCIPRSDQNHLGQYCVQDNCVFKKPKQTTLISMQANFTQKVLTVESTRNACFDLGIEQGRRASLNEIFSSIVNDTCVFLYDGTGCTGYFTKLSANTRKQCKNNETCFHHVSSLSFCSSYLSERYHLPLSHSGTLCKSACSATVQNEFNCQLHDGSPDVCSPRPRQSFQIAFR